MTPINEIFRYDLKFITEDKIYCEIHEFKNNSPVFTNIRGWNKEDEKVAHPFPLFYGFCWMIVNGDGSVILEPLSLYLNWYYELLDHSDTYIKLWVYKSLLKENNNPLHKDLINDIVQFVPNND